MTIEHNLPTLPKAIISWPGDAYTADQMREYAAAAVQAAERAPALSDAEVQRIMELVRDVMESATLVEMGVAEPVVLREAGAAVEAALRSIGGGE